MSQRRVLKHQSHDPLQSGNQSFLRRRKLFLVLSLIIGLIAAGGAFAHWGGLFSNTLTSSTQQVSPAGLSPSGPPAKEYIYAGGKLVATQQLESGGGSCSYSLNPSSANFSASAGTGSFAVTAGAGCGWTAVSNAVWITVTSGSSGTGNGTVNYSVTSNSATTQRTGTITVQSQTFIITQAGTGVSCSYSINPSNASFASTGGTGNVTVTAGAGCNWTAVSNNSWITITSGASGTGNGTVGYSVASNGSTSQRTGTMTIAGQTFTVTQAGSSGGGATCQFVSISPGTRTVNSSAASYSFNISNEVPSGCSWTATSNASWLTITSGSSGSGSATITYSVTQNTSGALRQGFITMNTGQKHTVKQNP